MKGIKIGEFEFRKSIWLGWLIIPQSASQFLKSFLLKRANVFVISKRSGDGNRIAIQKVENYDLMAEEKIKNCSVHGDRRIIPEEIAKVLQPFFLFRGTFFEDGYSVKMIVPTSEEVFAKVKEIGEDNVKSAIEQVIALFEKNESGTAENKRF